MSHKIDHKLKLRDQDLIEAVHEFDIDPISSHIYLFGSQEYVGEEGVEGGAEPGVEYVMSNRFIRNLNLCMRVDEKPILVHMKTCGGFWEEGMAIHNAIKACPNPVTILNYTHARSMSSLIFLAANKRVMMPDSYFMFHKGTEGIYGTYNSAQSYFENRSKKTMDRMVEIYVEALKERGKFSTWTRERIAKMLVDRMNQSEEVYLSAEEALEWGFADDIFGVTCPYDWTLLTQYTTEQLSR